MNAPDEGIDIGIDKPIQSVDNHCNSRGIFRFQEVPQPIIERSPVTCSEFVETQFTSQLNKECPLGVFRTPREHCFYNREAHSLQS